MTIFQWQEIENFESLSRNRIQYFQEQGFRYTVEFPISLLCL